MTDEAETDLRIAVMRLARRLRLERAEGDLTDSQLSVLFVLWKEGPQTLRSLAEHERVTPPSMNRTVNALVEAGVAARGDAPDDGRKVVVNATEAGIALALETRRRRAAWFSHQLEALDDDERALLTAAAPLLRRLADS
ncbi:MarR family transcriptional regulator [Leifsonia sp. H3M29-4]|uniref:MarR family winged helix-turn-helix transcriptional regulator n=1 Tax=Salinibacterium metalliresistens TaxID=3031321 RepID=UPI0023DA2152|nr:MarR family transcriptional regulator [Salinibacterium metalliresistens]MDF1477871.1 MarR family transcriptional regulator [Salinibacterium metalliresistens]